MTDYVCNNCGSTHFDLTNDGKEVCISCGYINDDKEFDSIQSDNLFNQLQESGFINGFEIDYL